MSSHPCKKLIHVSKYANSFGMRFFYLFLTGCGYSLYIFPIRFLLFAPFSLFCPFLILIELNHRKLCREKTIFVLIKWGKLIEVKIKHHFGSFSNPLKHQMHFIPEKLFTMYFVVSFFSFGWTVSSVHSINCSIAFHMLRFHRFVHNLSKKNGIEKNEQTKWNNSFC